MSPETLTSQADNRPVDFWERGLIRQIVEVEFQFTFVEELKSRQIHCSDEQEREIHNSVVPQVLFTIAEHILWLDDTERDKSFLMQQRRTIASALRRAIAERLDAMCEEQQSVLLLKPSFVRPFLVAFRRLPAILGKFFSP